MSPSQHCKNTLLLILDGLGLNDNPEVSATTREHMPYLHTLMGEHGFATIAASETAVGLDAGQAGNSEIGHMTIGAGLKLAPTLEKIRLAYESGEWLNSPCWDSITAEPNKPVHIVGLLSDAGIHGHWRTLCMSAELALKKGCHKVFVHAFLDGVDSQAGSAPALIHTLLDNLPENAVLASLMGRKWASDRAENWALTDTCVNALSRWDSAKRFSFDLLDEHLQQQASEANFPLAYFDQGQAIDAGDCVILSNHRADRISQLAKALSKRCAVTAMVELKHEAVQVNQVFFPTQALHGGLADVLADQGIKTYRLSESCKFPHVTYFINGMKESPLTETDEVPTIPDDDIIGQPHMSIAALASKLEERILSGVDQELSIVNIPNLDQVGHQGDFAAACAAANSVDELLKDIVHWCSQQQWRLLIVADHGNADVMKDAKGLPLGSHSKNPVPMLAFSFDQHVQWKNKQGSLANVAASLLTLMDIPEHIPQNWQPSLIEMQPA